jgi:MFS family permease
VALVDIGLNRTVAALSVARLADAVGNSILFIVIPLYVAALPAPWFPWPEAVRAGILISAYGFVAALLQPVAAALSDRFQKRKPFIQGGLLLMGCGTLAFICAFRFTDLLLLRMVQGIGVALTIPASMALMTGASNRRTRGGAMGFYSTARMGGFAAGPLMGGYLFERFGFNAAFYAGAFFILIAIVMIQFMVREPEQAASAERGKPFRLIDRELSNPGMLGAGFATFLMAASFSMMTPLETEFNARLHETAVDFGIAFSALMIGRLLFQVPLGRLSDVYGRKPFIIGGLLVLALTTPLLGFTATTEQLIWLRAVQGLASAAVAAPIFALAADLTRTGGEARQMSIITMGFGLGIACGPLIAGFLSVYSFVLPFATVGAALLASAGVVFRVVPETVRRDLGLSAASKSGH